MYLGKRQKLRQLSSLSDEILRNIISKLEINTIPNLLLSNERIYNTTLKADKLWYDVYQKHYLESKAFAASRDKPPGSRMYDAF